MIRATDIQVIRRHLTAPLAQVWQAWTDPAVVRRWCAPGDLWVEEATCHMVTGGTFRLLLNNREQGTRAINGTVLEVRPQQKLVFTWEWEGEFHQTLLTLELKLAAPRVTEVILSQERFIDAASRQRYLEGWESCLDKLAALIG